MIDEVFAEAKDRMAKAVEAAKEGFATVRTGRANPALLQNIMVEYYGTPTPLPQLASVQNQDARSLLVTPYDKSALQDIEKAIRDNQALGVNPTNDGNVVRVNLPELTEERRKDYVKLARNRAEDSRVQVRGIRGKSKKELEAIKKDGEAGEDDVKRAETELDALTKRFVEKIDAALSAKENELLEV